MNIKEDSVWANRYVTPMEEYKNGIHKDITFVEPFSFIDAENDGNIKNLNLKKKKLSIKKPLSSKITGLISWKRKIKKS